MAADMLKNPRKKKGAKNIPKESPFPVPIESITKKECCDSRWFYYTGYFRDNCVVVEDLGDLTFLYKMGFFGKGNLSRSKPEYEMISDISQKAFSNSEKLRRLPPKERQIRQSKFREIRKERFKNHLEWQKSLKDRNLSKTQDSSNNVQCTQDEKLHVLEQDLAWPSSSNAKTDTLSDRDVCKKRKIDEQEPEINENDSNDSDDSDDCDDSTEVTQSESNVSDVKTASKNSNKDINEVVIDVVMHSKEESPGSTENSLQPQSLSMKKSNQKSRKDDPYKVFEHLQLMLEEAFFLSYGLGCLTVYDDDKKALTLSEMWAKFCQAKKDFIPCYTVYHYFCSKGWVPKSGIKYGTDFVVYKEGMPYYHSSYSVIVQTADNKTLQPTSTMVERPISWASIGGLNRVSEHAAKEIMICYVIIPSDMTERELSLPNCICRFEVQEVVLRRWLPERSREATKS